MLTYYRQLLAFRRGHAVWGTGDMRAVSLDSAQIVAFVREDATERYLVVVNMTDEAVAGSAPDPLAGAATTVFGEGEVVLADGNVRVTLPAQGAAVFQIR
jgi:glycosidase